MMNSIPLPLPLPWIELSIIVSAVGAFCVAWLTDPQRAARWCLGFTFVSLACTLMGAVGFLAGNPVYSEDWWSLQTYLLHRPVLTIDDLNAPLLPSVALLHFLTALATPRTKMPRFSFAWLLAAGAVRLATFAATDPWVLICLMIAGTLPPYLELLNRRKPTRIYLLHMGLFIGLLVMGWALVESGLGIQQGWVSLPLLLAILVRSGTLPAHCWLTDLFEHATFGTALLVATPIVGVYAAIRLVLPIAPDWVLQSLGLISLTTAVYAAGMALVQRETRRFFAFLLLSHASLVLVGLELADALSLSGALCLWFSVVLSLSGLGLTLRALEARFGHLALSKYHGLYRHSPTLAVFFLLTALASVGFPGTLGFVSAELLVDGAIEANLYVGLAVIFAGAINSIAIIRVYFLLFTGAHHNASVPLNITLRERLAVLTLAALILGGGLLPQPGVDNRYYAAAKILEIRRDNLNGSTDKSVPAPILTGDGRRSSRRAMPREKAGSANGCRTINGRC